MTKLIRSFIYRKKYIEARDRFEQLISKEECLADSRAALGYDIIDEEELEQHTKDFNEAYFKYEELKKKMRL